MNSDKIGGMIASFLDNVERKYPVKDHIEDWELLVAKLKGLVDLHAGMILRARNTNREAYYLNVAREFLKRIVHAYKVREQDSLLDEESIGEVLIIDEITTFLKETSNGEGG